MSFASPSVTSLQSVQSFDSADTARPLLAHSDSPESPSSSAEITTTLLSLNTRALKSEYEVAAKRAKLDAVLARMGTAAMKAKAAESSAEAARLGKQLEEARAKSKELIEAEKARRRAAGVRPDQAGKGYGAWAGEMAMGSAGAC